MFPKALLCVFQYSNQIIFQADWNFLYRPQFARPEITPQAFTQLRLIQPTLFVHRRFSVLASALVRLHNAGIKHIPAVARFSPEFPPKQWGFSEQQRTCLVVWISSSSNIVDGTRVESNFDSSVGPDEGRFPGKGEHVLD